MNLDEMLLYYYYQKRELDRYLYLPLITGIVSSLGIAFGQIENKVFTVIIGVLCVSAIISLILMMKAYAKKCKFDDSLDKRADRVPQYKIQWARNLEDDIETALLWAIECEECHIPGDCPLCGAE